VGSPPSVVEKAAASAESQAPPLSDFGSRVDERLRRLMQREGRSFEKLAAFSGIARNKLESLAAGESVPTINLLGKLANALGVPVGSLISARPRRGLFVLRSAKKTVFSSSDGGFTARPLFPFDGDRLVEFYELTIASGHVEHAEAHAPRTLESLVVARGTIEVTAGREPTQRLKKGDAIVFESDVPHSYANLGSSDALLYLVMSYANVPSAREERIAAPKPGA